MNGVACLTALRGDVGIRLTATVADSRRNGIGRIEVLQRHVFETELRLERSGSDGRVQTGETLCSGKLRSTVAFTPPNP